MSGKKLISSIILIFSILYMCALFDDAALDESVTLVSVAVQSGVCLIIMALTIIVGGLYEEIKEADDYEYYEYD